MMKKLNVIVFSKENAREINCVCEKLADLPESKSFCGVWGEIQGNEQEILSAISVAVNYFLASDKEEVFFGCCMKDCERILAKINPQNCEVVKLSYRDIVDCRKL